MHTQMQQGHARAQPAASIQEGSADTRRVLQKLAPRSPYWFARAGKGA